MNHKTSIALVVAMLGAATSLHAETTTTKATAAQSEVTATSTPQIFLVQRGAPKSFASGLVYVDAAGHELSKSREYALEKASKSAAVETRVASKKST